MHFLTLQWALLSLYIEGFALMKQCQHGEGAWWSNCFVCRRLHFQFWPPPSRAGKGLSLKPWRGAVFRPVAPSLKKPMDHWGKNWNPHGSHAPPPRTHTNTTDTTTARQTPESSVPVAVVVSNVPPRLHGAWDCLAQPALQGGPSQQSCPKKPCSMMTSSLPCDW